MTTFAPTLTTPAEALRGLCGGAVHLPGDAAYDAARLPWNLAVDQRPAAVAVPRNADEVASVVRAAAAAGLRVAPQSTGHNAGPLAALGLDDVVVVRTGALDTAVADPARGIVRVGGGALWEPAVEVAAAHGRAVLHGSSPDVGVAGYTLGGGMGWYARSHGLACNSLAAVELVLADGTAVRADEHTEPELFWALRGGGGSFGVVTALELRTLPVSSAYAGLMLWDLAHLETVLRTWAAWAPEAPDEVTTSLRAMRLPPLPELPPFLRGRSVVIVDGAVLGSDERGAELLAHLRALRPEVDTFARMPAPALARLHMDPEGGAPVVSDSSVLASLPDTGVDAFVEAVGPDARTSVLVAELRQLGGALGRSHPGGGALDRVPGAFLTFAAAMAVSPEAGAVGRADCAAAVGSLAPWSGGGSYLNFCEEPVDVATAYSPATWSRLAAVRRAVDPRGVLAANHPVA